jgi:hypothetical protein
MKFGHLRNSVEICEAALVKSGVLSFQSRLTHAQTFFRDVYMHAVSTHSAALEHAQTSVLQAQRHAIRAYTNPNRLTNSANIQPIQKRLFSANLRPVYTVPDEFGTGLKFVRFGRVNTRKLRNRTNLRPPNRTNSRVNRRERTNFMQCFVNFKENRWFEEWTPAISKTRSTERTEHTKYGAVEKRKSFIIKYTVYYYKFLLLLIKIFRVLHVGK